MHPQFFYGSKLKDDDFMSKVDTRENRFDSKSYGKLADECPLSHVL